MTVPVAITGTRPSVLALAAGPVFYQASLYRALAGDARIELTS
jgi:hypothetical protein